MGIVWVGLKANWAPHVDMSSWKEPSASSTLWSSAPFTLDFTRLSHLCDFIWDLTFARTLTWPSLDEAGRVDLRTVPRGRGFAAP